jgi:hypothetical protein
MLEPDDKVEALSRQVEHLGGDLDRMAQRVQALQQHLQTVELLLLLVLASTLGIVLWRMFKSYRAAKAKASEDPYRPNW